MVESIQKKCRILIVENRDEARQGLAQALSALGHDVTAAGERAEALARNDLDEYDLIVSDLNDVESPAMPPNSADAGDIVKAFKVGVTSSRPRRAIAELHDIIGETLSFKLQRIDAAQTT